MISQLKKVAVIYFNTNEYFLDTEDRSRITAAALAIKNSSVKMVYVEGNTDVKKGVDNIWLSRARAEAVSDLLHSLVSKATVNRMWYADKRPVAPGVSKADLALNRRVEIFIPVTAEKMQSSTSSTPQVKFSRNFTPVTFNRNDFYLDAKDRKTLQRMAGSAAAIKCLNISLIGSRDSTKGTPNETIALDRIRAVRNYLHALYPAFRFVSEDVRISSTREVQISCTN